MEGGREKKGGGAKLVPCFEDVDTLRLSGGKSDSPSDFFPFFFFQTFPAPRPALLALPDGQRRERAPRAVGGGAVQGLGQRPGEGCTPCPSLPTALPRAAPRAPYGRRGAAAQPFPSRPFAHLTEVPAGTEPGVPPPGLAACGTGRPRVPPTSVPRAPCLRAGSPTATVLSEEGRHPQPPCTPGSQPRGSRHVWFCLPGWGVAQAAPRLAGRPGRTALTAPGQQTPSTAPRRRRAASLGVTIPAPQPTRADVVPCPPVPRRSAGPSAR